MNTANMSVLGHIVSLLSIMSADIAVSVYAVQQFPQLLGSQMLYFMIWQVAAIVGMSWYATTFSVSPQGGISISTSTGDETGVTTQPVVGVSPDGKTTIVIPTGFSIAG